MNTLVPSGSLWFPLVPSESPSRTLGAGNIFYMILHAW